MPPRFQGTLEDCSLVEAGLIEHEIAATIEQMRREHEHSPSPESGRRLERLEREHALVLELLLDLQRELLPPPLPGA